MNTTSRCPVLFVSHGAPTFALEPGLLGPKLGELGSELARPKAVLIISPHWMTPGVRVSTSPHPTTIHDFGGFSDDLYKISYPAPGEPAIAAQVVATLQEAGWEASPNDSRGLDHGAWVPLRYLFPDADVPVFQVSLPNRLTAATAYALGAALAPLRDAGVLIIGSGSLTHNLYEFRAANTSEAGYAKEFTHWVRNVVTDHDHALLQQTLQLAPHALRAHPTPEHFFPLLVAAGAAGEQDSVRVLEGGITHGVLAMESYVFGQAEWNQ